MEEIKTFFGYILIGIMFLGAFIVGALLMNLKPWVQYIFILLVLVLSGIMVYLGINEKPIPAALWYSSLCAYGLVASCIFYMMFRKKKE